MVDHIKSYGKINCPGQCAEWGTRLIKALLFYVIYLDRRADMVERLGRKPCWLGERGSELSNGCRRRSKTLAARQKKEIGR